MPARTISDTMVGSAGQSAAGPPRAPVAGSTNALELTAYRALTRLMRPAAGLILRLRLRRGKEDALRLGERLGVAGRPRPSGPLAWIHAASVGEANSVLPLMAAICERRPNVTLLLTTGTVTSARSISPRLPQGALHQFVPLDAPQLVGRFLDHWRPDLGVFTEQEIWPNLVVEAAHRGIPLALVNARMSQASFERWQRRPALARALFGRFATVLAQSDTFAERFAALGAAATRNVGNLKIDAPPPPVNAEARAALTAALGDRPHVLAASTHDGEEALLAAAHRELARRMPGICMVVVPRHPERGPGLVERLKADGFRVAARSLGELPDPATEIYIADTIGELGTFYATTSVAFIGGSLVAHGGQNPIEAVRHGAAVLTGPHTANFSEAYDALQSHGGVRVVESAAQIAGEVLRLLADPEGRAHQCHNAELALAELGGALERTLDELLPLLPPPPGEARRAS